MEKIICKYCGTKNNGKRTNCYMCGKELQGDKACAEDKLISEDSLNSEKNLQKNSKCEINKIDEDNDIKIYNLHNLNDNNVDTVHNKKRRISIITLFSVIIIFTILFICLYNIFKPDIEDVKDSVVMLVVYDENNNEIATGSGFCVFNEKIIATNFHVIQGAYKIKIITDDNKEFYAQNILIFNENLDLALIKVNNSTLKPLSISKKNNLKAGQKVVAIGSPAGELNTVSNGIISNVDNNYEIRITAPISHGSSGGVLLNDNNKVIGITYAGYDPNVAQNLNYAINVKYLNILYNNYNKRNFTIINSYNYKTYLGNINDLKKLGLKSSTNYNINDISILYNLTNIRKRFEELIINTGWYNVYNSLDESQKQDVIDLISYMNDYNFKFNYSAEDIPNWSSMDFFINLKFLEKYEFAIAYIKMYYANSSTEEINFVAEMPLDIELKMILIQLMGKYGINFIYKDYGNQIFEYIKVNCNYNRDKILEYLGYRIVYNSDNTFTAYW